jgi:DNA repair protein RadA/Sms
MRALRFIFYTQKHLNTPSIPNSLSFSQFSRHFLHSTPSLHRAEQSGTLKHSTSTETTPRAWSIYDPAPDTDSHRLPTPVVSNNSNGGSDGNGNAKKPNLGVGDIIGNKKKGKAKVSWVCVDCGHSDGQWWGTCHACNAVGTIKRFSEGQSAEVSETRRSWLSHTPGELRPLRLTDVNRGINQMNWRIPL